MDNVGGASHSVDHRLLVHEVSLDQLELVEEGTEGLANGRDLGLVRLVTDGTADAETAILEELKAGLATKIARDSGEGDEGFISLNHLMLDCFILLGALNQVYNSEAS